MSNFGWFAVPVFSVGLTAAMFLTKFGRNWTRKMLVSHKNNVLEAAMKRSVTTFAERIAATVNPGKADVLTLNRQLDAYISAVAPLLDLSNRQCAEIRNIGWKHAMERLSANDDVGDRLREHRQNVRPIRR